MFEFFLTMLDCSCCAGLQVFQLLQMPNIEFLLPPCLLLREIVDLYDFNVSKFKYWILVA
ncbi:hypothetical protein GLYMA_12G195000v4 [Glycine max]|nr:hypothetical protein GLYMA_12G195000v4 [Glycine max]